MEDPVERDRYEDDWILAREYDRMEAEKVLSRILKADNMSITEEMYEKVIDNLKYEYDEENIRRELALLMKSL